MNMKKLSQLFLMGAVALIGTIGITACSSTSEETAEITNPNYDPIENAVKVQFVYNVNTNNGTTRQTSAATQATETENFRGIDNTVIFSYKQAGYDGHHLAALPENGLMDKRYDLAEILAPNTIDADNTRRVIETSLPLNTNTLLFYGRAMTGSLSTAEITKGLTTYDVFGHLDNYQPGNSTNLAQANFQLGRRMTEDKVEEFKKIEDLLAAVLTAIMHTNMSGDRHVDIDKDKHPGNDPDIPAYGFDVSKAEYPHLVWADFANDNGTSPMEATHELYPLEKKLADVYREMTNIKQSKGELRAGSGKALESTIQDMWSVINEVRCATPLNKPETVAKYLAELVNERLLDYFNYTSLPKDGAAVLGVQLKTANHIITTLGADIWPETADAKPTNLASISSIDLGEFPSMYHLPGGATHLQFDTTKKQFSYVWNYNTSAVGNAAFTVRNYYYPAEMLYFGNSPIRVSNSEHKPDTYPNGVANWNNDGKWGADWTKNSHVVSTTQSVAMQNDVHYGTALLKTTIRYGANVLNDNNHAIQKAKDPSIADTDEPDNQITVNGTTFRLEHVIISGQPRNVGWDFLPTSDTEKGYVTDMAIPTDAAKIPAYTEAGAKSVPNYTMVFDNYTTAATGQEKVYVALELRNNSGKDFFGLHNIIRNGSTFYLIGELDPTKVADFTWPATKALPPYDSNGNTIEAKRVFIQSFMTTADFVIGPNSLKYAYLTVPDLRYSALTLGLSVDIKWSTGLNFNNVILGGDN